MSPTQNFTREVPEREATGRIAALYADIRETAGLAMVNMLYRRMAVEPDCLEWVWATVRPLLVSGTADAAAAALRAEIEAAAVPSPLPREALHALGLTGEDIAVVAAVVEGYNRANPKNVVLMAACAAALGGGTAAPAVAGPVAPPDPLPPLPPLPPLTEVDDMDPGARAAVRGLTAHRTGTPSVASLYRHLARWPAVLVLALARLGPALADGSLRRRAEAARDRGRVLIGGPAGAPSAPPAPGSPARALLDDILANFPANMAEMAVIGVELQRMLPDRT